ncbi:MAG: hypothetical protein U0575_07510 [Phycisphaerales bacterium]
MGTDADLSLLARSHMLDGSPALRLEDDLLARVVVHDPDHMQAIGVEEHSSGPGLTSATVTLVDHGRKQVREIAYWRVTHDRVDAIGSIADIDVGPVDPATGVAPITVLLAHRAPGPIAWVDPGGLALTLVDPNTLASARLTTWGGEVIVDGEPVYQSMSSIEGCVIMTVFSADVAADHPVLAALDDNRCRADWMWILSGWGFNEDLAESYQLQGAGALATSSSAAEDVAALADRLGWTSEALDPSNCAGWHLPPIAPCVWEAVPLPSNPPAAVAFDSGSSINWTWYGTWWHNGVAHLGGSQFAKRQEQFADTILSTSPWSPGTPCIASWSGNFIIERSGSCGTCPCSAVVTAAPRAKVAGWLDAVASVSASLDASINVGGYASQTGLSNTFLFGSSEQYHAGGTGPGVTWTPAGSGVVQFAQSAGPTPGPLVVAVSCGATGHVSNGFGASGFTKLSSLVDFPYNATAGFGIGGSATYSMKIVPVQDPASGCTAPPAVQPWHDPEHPTWPGLGD